MQLILTKTVIVLENKIIPDVIRLPPKLLTFGGFLDVRREFMVKIWCVSLHQAKGMTEGVHKTFSSIFYPKPQVYR